MAEAVSALAGRSVEGPVRLRDAGLRGMITLRGDLEAAALREVCTDLTQVAFPDRGRAELAGQRGLVWMSPDEVLVMVQYDKVDAALTAIAAALAGTHHLAVDVSDARAVIVLEGDWTREVLAKLAPVDLHPDVFGPGDTRRTRLGQVAAAFWMRDGGTCEVVCFRSVADYTFDLLAASVAAGPVGHLPG